MYIFRHYNKADILYIHEMHAAFIAITHVYIYCAVY